MRDEIECGSRKAGERSDAGLRNMKHTPVRALAGRRTSPKPSNHSAKIRERLRSAEPELNRHRLSLELQPNPMADDSSPIHPQLGVGGVTDDGPWRRVLLDFYEAGSAFSFAISISMHCGQRP